LQDSNNSTLVFLIQNIDKVFRQILRRIIREKETNGKNPDGNFYRNQRNLNHQAKADFRENLVRRLRAGSQYAPASRSGTADRSRRESDSFDDGKPAHSLLLPKPRNAVYLSKIFMPILVLKKMRRSNG
jgi:hypothetical protein